MKTYLNILICLFISQLAQAQVDLEKYNKASTNQEYIDLLTDDFQSLNRFMQFFLKDNDAPRTPSEVAPLKLAFNQRDYDANINQITQANIQFYDYIVDDFFSVKLVKDPSIYSSLDDIKAPIYLKKVYYYDGTTQDIKDKTDINTYFTAKLALTKSVAKIDIEIAFSTMQKLDSVVLPAKVHQKARYRGVDIEVAEVSDKGVLLKTSSDELAFNEVQAILKDKRRVSSYSSQRSGMHPDKFNLFLKGYIQDINTVLTFANANAKMEYTEFKPALEKKISALETKWMNEFNKSKGVSYLYYEFGEPLDQVVLYNTSETYQKNVMKTLINVTPKSRFIANKENKTRIYDSNLMLLKEFTAAYTPINDYYFE